MKYVLAVVTHFSGGSREVVVKARGRSISRAVDVRDRARPFHSRCLRARCADREGETDGGGRPPDEREQHRDHVVEVRSGRGRHLSARCLAPRMSPVEVLLLLALAAFFAGLGGSYLGIGGGVFLVPFMTLVL